jgi:hypothetical protein
MSRNAPEKEPSKLKVMCSSTRSEPSGCTATATSARGRVKDFAAASPDEASATRTRAAVDAASELDAWRLPGGGVLDFEVGLLGEAEDVADDVRRHGFERGVVGEDDVVVDLSRECDLPLRLLELALKLLEVLARPELGVVPRPRRRAGRSPG